MKRISLLTAIPLIFLSSWSFGKDSVTAPTHPASKEWVLEQLAQLQIPTSQLTAANWTALCPSGQTIDSSTGCTPNCVTQKTACEKFLDATEIEDHMLLSSTAPTGLTVFRSTIQPTFSNQGPTFSNNSTTNSIRCQTFTVKGTLLNNYNDNFLLPSSGESNQLFSFYQGIDMSHGNPSVVLNLLSNSPNNGSQRSNQQYYIACMSYTTTSNIATNVNMDGTLSVTWS